MSEDVEQQDSKQKYGNLKCSKILEKIIGICRAARYQGEIWEVDEHQD